jgi:hypothetical protein
VGAGEVGDSSQDPLDRSFIGQLQVRQVARAVEEVDVGVVETGQDRAAAGIDNARS